MVKYHLNYEDAIIGNSDTEIYNDIIEAENGLDTLIEEIDLEYAEIVRVETYGGMIVDCQIMKVYEPKNGES